MINLKKKTVDALRHKIWPWDATFLPFWWYRSILSLWHPGTLAAIKEIPKGIELLNYSAQIAICCCDKKYIDDVCREVDIDQMSTERQQQAYFDIGTALCDLGYRDKGINFLERAAAVDKGLPGISRATHYQLCCRLSERKYWAKRLEYALAFERQFPQNEDFANRLLAKSYTDLEQFGKAENEINKLVDLHSHNNIFWADFYYSKEDYKSAAEIYEKYKLDEAHDYWRAQYDYKEAIAYYKTNQTEKWKRKAREVGRRLAWDKFYSLDYLEREGVKRVAEIDEIIYASVNQKRLFNVDKITFAFKRLPWILWKTVSMYRYRLLCLLVWIIFCTMFLYSWLSH